MFKSLDSIASVVGIVMYLTISKFKQVLRSRKGLGKVSTTTLIGIVRFIFVFAFVYFLTSAEINYVLSARILHQIVFVPEMLMKFT